MTKKERAAWMAESKRRRVEGLGCSGCGVGEKGGFVKFWSDFWELQDPYLPRYFTLKYNGDHEWAKASPVSSWAYKKGVGVLDMERALEFCSVVCRDCLNKETRSRRQRACQ